MNLVFHQFKKDVRQFRVFLGIWSGLLLIDLAVNLGWIGQASFSPERGFNDASNTWTAILPGVLWVFVGLLPSLVVLADSPARRDGFLATRPLSKRDLLLGKILFILALVVAPWVASELIHLVWRGMPAWVWVRGTLERLMFTLPVALICGAFAVLWPNVARWVRAIAGCLVAYVLLGMLISFCFRSFHVQIFATASHNAPLVVHAYASMLALVGFAVWHSRAQRGVLARWGGLLAAVFVSSWLVSWWPWDSLQPLPENQAAANSLLAQSGWKIPSRAITLQREQGADGGSAQFSIGVTPRLKTVPAGCAVGWSGKDARLSRAAGGELCGDGKTVHAQLFEGNQSYSTYSDADLKAWAGQFPEDVLFRQDDFSSGINFLSIYLYLSKFNVPASRAEMTEPLTLSASLEARVFQWRKIADLPLTPGATSKDEFGSFKFISGHSRFQHQGDVYFLRQQIELSTVADLRCSTAFGGPLSRLTYMVYDPLSHTVWLPERYRVVKYPRATHTALAEYYTALGFRAREAFTADEQARCRLIVFEKTWLGSVPEPFKSTAFTLADKLPENAGASAANTDGLTRSEFGHRIDALKIPAPDAPRNEVSLYLLDYLRLVDAGYRWLEFDDPYYVTPLAKFVPHHLELLLNGLPAMSYHAQQLVLKAIIQGATEAQKPDLIAALLRQPELAEVLLARDWVVAARPEIYQLLKSDRPLPLPAIQAVAWFHDPATYPRLLAEFEANPNEGEDELLHKLGLNEQLEPIIARNWRAAKLATSPTGMFQTPFLLAMRHGDPSTLERVYRLVIDDKEPARRMMESSLAYHLTAHIQMTGIKNEDRQDDQTVLAWMQKHRPEDFVFNPARRQFVLKNP